MAEQGSPASIQKVIFDTDVLIWYLRGYEKARRFIEAVAHERRALSSLTFMELLQGCRNREEVREVKAFVSENISLVIHPDENHLPEGYWFVRAPCLFPWTAGSGRNYCGKRS